MSALRQRTEEIACGGVDFPSDKIEFEPGSEDQGRDIRNLRKINHPSSSDGFFLDHARKPALLEAVASLLGPDLKLFGDQLFVKPPGGIEKTYHQDSPYFKIEPMALVTA
ncbi:MAG: phytanoyl-CoA dioxygenase family protein, partial [Candidatus Aminicenantes bacterium]|nr:phytanoyl-CoA dioxygenase family protein [Candidatus Aminicenantes bacterium]